MPTEQDIIKLAEEVGEVDFKDPVVRAFLTSSLRANEDEEKRLQATFRISKLLRNDQQMQQVAEQLRKVREMIGVIKQLIGG